MHSWRLALAAMDEQDPKPPGRRPWAPRPCSGRPASCRGARPRRAAAAEAAAEGGPCQAETGFCVRWDGVRVAWGFSTQPCHRTMRCGTCGKSGHTGESCPAYPHERFNHQDARLVGIPPPPGTALASIMPPCTCGGMLFPNHRVLTLHRPCLRRVPWRPRLLLLPVLPGASRCTHGLG